MENSEKKAKKKKIPLFPTLKTSNTVRNFKGHPMISDSSDDSDILENLSDYETNEEQYHTIYSKMNNKKNNNDLKLKGLQLLDLNKSNSDINSCLTPRPTLDAFRDIEEYVAKSTFAKNKINYNNENKNLKDEGKTSDIRNIKKDNLKIVNDFYINNEGDIIELTDNTQNNEENNNIILGPLMEEDENFNSIFINQNKPIFSSIKELWEYQKILLENQIFDMKSKK